MDATRIQTSQLGSDGDVLDACYTLAGDKVATCSSTGTIQVWSCSNIDQEWDLLHVEELPDQPRQLAWAHPEHGSVLAIGTVQGTVHVLQGPSPCSQQQHEAGSSWRITGRLACGQGAVSTLAFAPRQHGLLLAVACQDKQLHLEPGAGASRVMLYEAGGIASRQLRWTLSGKRQLSSDVGSCRCLCWREASVGLPPLLVVGHSRGGSIWAYTQATMQWEEVCMFAAPFSRHPQAVEAVHWAPALGRPQELLAVSYGTTVVIYRVSAISQDSTSSTALTAEQLRLEADVMSELLHPAPVWRLEFNMMGNTLACSLDGTPEVWFWMPRLIEEPWRVVSKIKGQQPEAAHIMSD